MHCIGHPGHYGTTIRVAAKHDVLEVLPLQHVAYIENMQAEIHFFACEM